MRSVVSRMTGFLLGSTLAVTGSYVLARVLFDGFAPPAGANPDSLRMAFILLMGPAIAGATISGAIGGASQSWRTALIVAGVGMTVVAVPIAGIVLLFGTLGGIDRFGAGEQQKFGLYLLQGFVQAAGPLVVAPLAAVVASLAAAVLDRAAPHVEPEGLRD